MEGIIGFYGYNIDCIIGVYAHERQSVQKLYVDLKVKVNFKACSVSDDLTDTLNYELLGQLCEDIARAGHFKLLESFATAVLEAVFSHFDVSWAWVCVRKPAALPAAEYGFVELELTRL